VLAANGQNTSTPQDNSTPAKKEAGSIYFTWGYNRDFYSTSTIHFVNTDPTAKSGTYDFTFHNAKAKDKPDMNDYWNIGRLTVPQYDINLGYMFNDRHDLGIEIGWNHLKYVVIDNQRMHVTGTIRGQYIDADTLVTPDFVHLQHTNGNNYLMLSLVKRKNLWMGKNFGISVIGKVGAGPMISYTISTILGSHDNGRFHYHGWVAGASLGARVSIYKHFFVQSDAQGAYAKYTNTEMGEERTGRSTQHFYSLQWTWECGVNFPLRF